MWQPAGCDCKPTWSSRQLARVPRIHARLAHSSLLLRARCLLGSPSRGLHACFCLASDLVSSHLSSARVPCAPHRPVPGACMPPSSFHGPPSFSLSPSLPLPRCVLSQARGGATRWARWHDTNEKGLRWAVAGPAGTHTLPRRGNIRWARSREARESRSSSLHPADRRIYFERRGRRSGYGAPASAGVEAAPRRVSSTL